MLRLRPIIETPYDTTHFSVVAHTKLRPSINLVRTLVLWKI